MRRLPSRRSHCQKEGSDLCAERKGEGVQDTVPKEGGAVQKGKSGGKGIGCLSERGKIRLLVLMKKSKLSANVTAIERGAFYHCVKLEHLTLPEEVIIPDSVSKTNKALLLAVHRFQRSSCQKV